MKYGLKDRDLNRLFEKELWKQTVQQEIISLKLQVASLKDQLQGEKSFATVSLEQSVDQEFNSLKFEIASLKEQLSNCISHLKFLGERIQPEHPPASPIKGFERTPNPFLKNESNGKEKKINFTFQVSAAIKNNEVISLEPKVESSFSSECESPTPKCNGTYGYRFRPTLTKDTIFSPASYIKYQSISCMGQYADKSFEELRYEDYNIIRSRQRCSNQVKFKGAKWSSRKPLRRFSYSRKEKHHHSPQGTDWFVNEPKFSPTVNSFLNSHWPSKSPFTFNTNQKQNTAPNLFQNVKFNPWIPFGSHTTDNSSVKQSTGQSELLNLVVSKLDKIEYDVKIVNKQLLTLGSQVSRMDSRLETQQPGSKYMYVFGRQTPLKEKGLEAPKEQTKSQATNTEQNTFDAVNKSPRCDKNTSTVATNTLPLTPSPSVPLIERSSNLILFDSPSPNTVPQSKFRFSSPMFLKTSMDDGDISMNAHISTTDEDKMESKNTEKKKEADQQNSDMTDSKSELSGTNQSNISVTDNAPVQTEENISDSEKDFEIVEKEELAQQISGQNVSGFSSLENKVVNDITEYMEVHLGRKKGEVYEFGFEVVPDGVDSAASTSAGENQSINKDDSFSVFVRNLIDETKLKHSSPCVIPQKDLKGDKDSSSKNSPDASKSGKFL